MSARILTPSGLLPNGQVIILDEGIVEITGRNREIPHAEIINAKGYYVAPGCIDTHVYSGNGHDFTEATPRVFYAITRAHASQETTALYPTLVVAPIDTLREAIRACEHIMNHPEQGARIVGLYLEGNCLNMAMKGGQDPNYIYPPDPQGHEELLNSIQYVKCWNATPGLDGVLEFGKYALAHGVLVSLAHTTADYLQVKKAYEAGFTHAVHFYNAITSIHRDRGCKHERTVEGIYLMKDMAVEVVADSIHVPSAILKLVYQIKGVERTSLITDAMATAACDNGTGHFPGSRVIIEEDICKLTGRSAIAGSIAIGIRLIRALVKKAEIPLHDAVCITSKSLARLMGLLDREGTLERGKGVDIIIFSNDIEIQEAFIRGKRLPKG